MTQSKTATKTGAAPDLDPAARARQELLDRQRFLAARKLLRRRRRKSHQ